MLIFQRPEFISGKMKITDLKLDSRGLPMRVLVNSFGKPIRVMFDENRKPIKFKHGENGKPETDDKKRLIPDPNGKYILSGSGVVVPDPASPLLTVSWVLTPGMRGQVMKFNDEGYVKKLYPNIFFKSKTEYQSFLAKKKSNKKRMDTKKADRRQKELEQEMIDDPNPKLSDVLEKFKIERKRYKR